MKNQLATKSDLKELGERIDARLGGIDARLGGIDARLGGIDARLDGHDARLDGHDARFEGLDAKMDRVIVLVARHEGQLVDMAARMVTKEDLNRSVDRIMNSIDKFAGQAQNYDRAATLHGSAITDMKFTIEDHARRINALESGPARDAGDNR